MSTQPEFPIRVFYDGLCSVCATEIEHYLRHDHNGRLIPIDIGKGDFDPEPYHIPLDAFLLELHVIDQRGTVFRGVEAFWAIWQAFPTSTLYGFMGRLIHWPIVNPLARLLYKLFARIRQYLPKRKSSCTNGICRISKHGDP